MRSASFYFNPRPHAGATIKSAKSSFSVLISIHAPSRGRLLDKWDCTACLRFQPTPPHGGDSLSKPVKSTGLQFQSTPPHGGDFVVVFSGVGFLISIHAPSRGRHPKLAHKGTPVKISIHAPIRGRLPSSWPENRWQDFNPRPHTGATKQVNSSSVARL